MHMFADDTLIYLHDDDIQDGGLTIICEWLCRNSLSINLEKT